MNTHLNGKEIMNFFTTHTEQEIIKFIDNEEDTTALQVVCNQAIKSLEKAKKILECIKNKQGKEK